MHRTSSDHYKENSQIISINAYPPIPNISKMHNHTQRFNPSQMSYYENSQSFEFISLQPLCPSNKGYDALFTKIHKVSEPNDSIILTPPVQINSLPNFDVRPSLQHDPSFFQIPKGGFHPGNFNLTQACYIPGPQLNVVQRISGIIKSQLSLIQSIVLYSDQKTQQQKNKKVRQRSRSRSRDRNRINPRLSEKQHCEWNCTKCLFLNFDFRNRCKRCNQKKAQFLQRVNNLELCSGGKNFIPQIDDWRCKKCDNINYPHQLECYRCHTSRDK